MKITRASLNEVIKQVKDLNVIEYDKSYGKKRYVNMSG